jgi:hypothetical protein
MTLRSFKVLAHRWVGLAAGGMARASAPAARCRGRLELALQPVVEQGFLIAKRSSR